MEKRDKTPQRTNHNQPKKVGRYSFTRNRLVPPVEVVVSINTEFNSPSPTLQGTPSLNFLEERKKQTVRISTLLKQLLTLSKEEDGRTEALGDEVEELEKQKNNKSDRLQIEPFRDDIREGQTLVMPVMDNEIFVGKKDEWVTSIQEFAEEFQQKTGPIILSQGNLEKIKRIIIKLKEMDKGEREKIFPKIPLIVRRQILKILAQEAAQKKVASEPPIQKTHPPINITVTLGKEPHVQIKPMGQKND